MGFGKFGYAALAASVTAMVCTPAQAQGTDGERPWLDGVPIVEQSLELPAARSPKLDAPCDLPQVFETIRQEAGDGPYSDPRYLGWLEDYHRCDYDKLARSLEADITGGAPHPLARIFWASLQHQRGQLAPGWEARHDPALVAALGPVPALLRQYEAALDPAGLAFLRSLSKEQMRADPFANKLVDWQDSAASLDLALSPAEALGRNPELFISWWSAMERDADNIEAVGRLTGPGGALADHFMAPYLRMAVLESRYDDQLRIEIANAWLERYPNDAFALRMKGWELSDMGRAKESTVPQLREMAIAPYLRATSAARRLYESGNFEAGDEVIARSSAPAAKKEMRYVAALDSAGFVHQSRGRAETLVARDPSWVEIRRELADSYDTAGQTSLALAEARKIRAAAPPNWLDAARHIKMLRKEGLAREALAAFDEATAQLGQPNWAMIDEASRAARALNDTEREKALLGQARAAGIVPMTVLRSTIELHERLGEHDKVVGLSRELLTGMAAYRSDHRRFLDSAHALRDLAGVEEAFSWAKGNSANPKEAYYAMIEKLDSLDADARRDAVTAMAQAEFPDQFWPIYNQERYAGAPETRGDYEARKAKMEAVLPRLRGEEGEWAVRNLMFLGRQAARNRLISQAELAEYEAYFEQYRPQMSLSRAASAGRSFYEALGRDEDAAGLWRDYAANTVHLDDPLTRLRIKAGNTSQDGFGAIWRSLQASRYDATRLRDIIHAHSKWGGSSILAACLGNWADENFPEAVPTIATRRQDAMNSFGGDEEFFRQRYANASTVGASQRYIGWYHATKAKALEGGKFVDFDCDRGVVTTVDRDGKLTVRQEDYRTGKITLMAEGSSWLRYDYSDLGNVTRMYTSDGRDVRLSYNDAGKIVRMTTSKGEELDFEYGPSGKPTVISVDGVGKILTEYDERGEIVRVTGQGPDGEEGGHQIALRVTQAFQSLLSLSDPRRASRILNEDVPELKALATEVMFDRSPVAADVARAAEVFSDIRRTNRTASSTMDNVDAITVALGNVLAQAPARDFAAFGTALHGLFADVSPFGLPTGRWMEWTGFLKIAESRAGEQPIGRMLTAIRTNPLSPMESATAVNLEQLRNPGFWYVDTPGTFLPARLRDNLDYSAVLTRANGEKVAASNAGLLVMQQGNWRRYAFRAERNAWFRDDLAEFDSDPIEVTSLADLPGGRLAVGTNRGIYVLGADYASVVDRAGSGTGGLAAGTVNDLLVAGNTLYVASAGGISRLALGADGSLGSASAIASASARTLGAGPGNSVIAAGEGGIHLVSDAGIQRVAGMAARDAAYSAQDGRIIALQRGKLYSSQREGAGWSAPVELTHGGSAQIGSEGFGLVRATLGGTDTVAALGQDGFAVWQNGYFEHFPLPYADNLPSAHAARLGDAGGLVAGGDGALYRFEPGRTALLGGSTVRSSAYDPQSDIAYFADGSQIRASLPTEQGAAPEIRTFDFVRATHLDMGPQGGLVANDGNIVLRYARGSSDPQQLFAASPYCPEDWECDTRLVGLLAASDGSVWATAGASAFHWKDGEVTEYNWFEDPKAFPVNTHWLGQPVELPDGSIVISASNEAHLTYRGQVMRGENLIFRGGRFESFDSNVLFTSATPIDDGGAILGSTRGFYEADQLGVTSLASSQDRSYLALRDRHPNLFLGGEAATIGSETLLFPTPAGIAAYQSGNWFYPERLNWQYPDPSKADIGARHTYTVQVDKAGRIYAGTDAGLVVFQQFGGDAVDFLMENARPDLAFASFERRKLRREAAALIDGIEPGTPEFAELERIMSARKDIASLRQQAAEPRGTMAASGSGSSGVLEDGSRVGPAPGSRLAEEIRAKEREYTRMLAELERKDPGLAQLVTIQPLELAALQDKIPSDAVIVQYIPQGEKLLLHVLGRDVNHVEEVAIGREDLFYSALEANFFLEEQAAVAEGMLQEGDSIFAASNAAAELPSDTPRGDLAGLYEVLLAPIEDQIDGFDRVYISAAGSLNYVPFSALVREREGKRQYAVERYTFAMIPTSYLLQLVMQDQSVWRDTALVYGNPDGTLQYAEEEAGDVRQQVSARMSDVIVRTGDAATIATLREHGSSAGLLHFATHGKLDPAAPERSYLVLGDNTRIDAIDIMTLDLQDAELAFLSACETGRGGDGLEFATLARAFSHAGVPTTIASLWPVGDNATLKLVHAFYETYGDDAAKALADAQRAMIAQPGAMAHPATWAPFQVYGRGYSNR